MLTRMTAHAATVAGVSACFEPVRCSVVEKGQPHRSGSASSQRDGKELRVVHVVIMGCGRVGSTLARAVEKRGHTVAIIDSNPDAFRRLGPSFSGDKITGVGFDQTVLEAGRHREAAGAFAAVSSGDNSNIISARVARETFGIDNVVARIYDPGRAEVYQRLGIPTVATVRWTADQMLRRLMPDGSRARVARPVRRDSRSRSMKNAPPRWIGHHVFDLEPIGARVAS